MDRISDSVLIGELKNRLDESKKALNDLRQITKKLEKVNAKLRESEAMKSNFLSNIRNEIYNPLTSIIGLSDQMIEGQVQEDDVREISRMIYMEAFALDSQLKNIFLAAELEAGEAHVAVARIDIASFIERVVSLFSYRIKLKSLNISLRCESRDLEGDARFFNSDPEKLHAILVNLIDNAVEFSLDNTQITIKQQIKDNSLVISIKDEGIGIEAQKQKDILDRFKQLSSGAQKTHKGHGLGLSVIKSLMDILGGEIKISSVVGKGSTFTVSIPQSPYTEGANIYAEDGNELIFDDDSDISEKEVQEF